MNKTQLVISSDYATMYVQSTNPWDIDETKLSFYYGYEETENDEWMFVVKQNSKVLKSYTTTEIEGQAAHKLRNMDEYLLVGVNMYLNKF